MSKSYFRHKVIPVTLTVLGSIQGLCSIIQGISCIYLQECTNDGDAYMGFKAWITVSLLCYVIPIGLLCCCGLFMIASSGKRTDSSGDVYYSESWNESDRKQQEGLPYIYVNYCYLYSLFELPWTIIGGDLYWNYYKQNFTSFDLTLSISIASMGAILIAWLIYGIKNCSKNDQNK